MNGYIDGVAGFSKQFVARPNSSRTTCFTPVRRTQPATR